MTKTILGKLPGSSSVVRIDFNRVIQSVDELIRPPETDDYVAAGLIDIQVNGFAGVDFHDPTASHDSLLAAIRRMAATGVTRCFPTVITGSAERMTGALRNLADARESWEHNGLAEAPVFEAFHVEGPHISPDDGPRGAHPKEHVRPPDMEEFERMQEAARGNIRMVTLSPEWDGSPRYIAHLIGAGVVASIGHTKANAEQIRAAVDAGATMSTHLGNGAHAVLPKTQNYLWEQLVEDRLTAGFIVDGIHLPASFLRTALRAKGLERSVLVTDASTPATCPPGPYALGGMPVDLRVNGSVVLRGTDRLAGSALRMDDAIANTMRIAGTSLREALAMATTNAARSARIPGRLRGLTPGEKADLIRFRWDAGDGRLKVLETIVAGETIHFEAQNASTASL
jgi:N-acetylglucosamine-6-phosphate deacetylase